MPCFSWVSCYGAAVLTDDQQRLKYSQLAKLTGLKNKRLVIETKGFLVQLASCYS